MIAPRLYVHVDRAAPKSTRELMPCRVNELVYVVVDRICPYATRVGLDLRVNEMSLELALCSAR
jgi:hypothetical protein